MVGILFILFVIFMTMMTFKVVSKVMKVAGSRKKMFNIIFDNIQYQNANGFAKSFNGFQQQAVNPDFSDPNFADANASFGSATGFKLSDDQLKMLKSFVPEYKPLEWKKWAKKVAKTTLVLVTGVVAIVSVFYAFLVILNHYLFMFA